MKKSGLYIILIMALFFVVSCGGEEDDPVDTGDTTASDTGSGDTGSAGDTGTVGDTGSGDTGSGDTGYTGDTGTPDSGDTTQQGVYVNCTPGERTECYEGPSGTADVGICKKGYKECVEDGTDWSECREQVLPKAEICGDGVDQDCDGSDLTAENAIDIDGDGYTYCNGDCCETTWDCKTDPTRVGPNSFEIPGNMID